MNLRDYQTRALDLLRNVIRSGFTRPILLSPTGSGKTVMAMEIIRRAKDNGKHVLFLAPRRELIMQTSKILDAVKIIHGVIMAGEPRDMHSKVQVGTFDTLHARAIRSERMLMPKADLVLVDEAHLSISRTRQEIIQHYPDAIVIGLTATPARGDGRGLGEIYNEIVPAANVKELTEQGHLVPVRYFAPSEPDLKGLKKNRDGDYVEKALGERMDQAQLIGDIVQNWFRLAKGKSTVVFCVTCAHSRHVRDEFLKAGISAEHVDGNTPHDERKAIMQRVSEGKTMVLCNVYVASYGLDIPRLECAVLARPTKNITLYLQTAGRVLRPFEGKREALIIDHSGAVKEHGFVDDMVPWTLDETDVREAKKKAKEEAKEPKEITCGECGTVFKSRRNCPICGHEMIPATQEIPTHAADLEEIEREQRKLNRDMSSVEKKRFFGMLKGYAKKHGFNPGWCSHKYRALTGVWPNAYKNAPMLEPSSEVLNWIKSQNIRYAKRRAA